MSKHWLNGKALIDRWNIYPFELLDFCKKGLQPYTKYGKKIVDIDLISKKAKFSRRNVEDLLA